MRTWLTYLSASLLGLATAWFFGESPEAFETLSSVNTFLLNLGLCLTLLSLPFTFTSGIAALGREKKGRKVLRTCLAWSFLAAFLLAFLGALAAWLCPMPFPATETSSLSPGTLSGSVGKILSNAFKSLSLFNPLWTAGTTMNFFPPLLVILFLVGLAASGSQEEFRPAFSALTSFAEVMRRVSRNFTIFGFPLAFSSSSVFFLSLGKEGGLSLFAKGLGLASLAALIIVLPLAFAVYTRFKVNPYRVLLRSLPALFLALFSSNRNMSLSIETALSSDSIGNDKNVSSVSAPLMLVLGKGGSAFVSVIAVISVIFSTTGGTLNVTGLLLAALAAASASFLSSAASGAEPALVAVLTLNFLGLELYGAENAIIALLPLIAGLGSLLDCSIAMLGTSAAAFKLGAVYDLDYEDIL